MSNLFGRLIADELIKLFIATPSIIEGCTEAEINGLKRQQQVDYLPAIYEEYLAVLGKKAGNLHIGSEAFYPAVRELKTAAERLLESVDYPFLLPDDAFVFYMHQCYQFMFFCTGSRDVNPHVYYFTIDADLRDQMPMLKYNHLSEFLSTFIADIQGKTAHRAFLERWESSGSRSLGSR